MKTQKIIVLGSGLVGAPMALDLARDPQFVVTVADISSAALQKLAEHKNIKTVQADLADVDKVKELVGGQDLAVNAVPGFLGFQTLRAVIESRKDVIDIAFFPEDPFHLDELAKKNGVTAIVDCGVAPGMSNVLVGHVHHLLDRTHVGPDLRGRPAGDPRLALRIQGGLFAPGRDRGVHPPGPLRGERQDGGAPGPVRRRIPEPAQYLAPWWPSTATACAPWPAPSTSPT